MQEKCAELKRRGVFLGLKTKDFENGDKKADIKCRLNERRNRINIEEQDRFNRAKTNLTIYNISGNYRQTVTINIAGEYYLITFDEDNATDKNKWGDFKISLEWDEQKLKSMLAYRISKAINPNGDILSFEKAWSTIFTGQTINLGGNYKKKIDLFHYITLSTQLRPRDYIKYLQVCAENTIENGETKITAQTVKRVDKGFSNYLKEEIVDEIHAQLPDILVIFSIISQIRKWNFTIKEFKETYIQYLKKGTVQNGNVDYVLQLLFDFSIIGNRPKNRTISFFRYINPEARFNFNENIVVHRGLFKALQIL